MLTMMFKNGYTIRDEKVFADGYKGYKHVAVSIREETTSLPIIVMIAVYIGDNESNLRTGIHIYLEEVEGEVVISGQFVNVNGTLETLREDSTRLGIQMISDGTVDGSSEEDDNLKKYMGTGYLEKFSLNEILEFLYKELEKSLRRTRPEAQNNLLKEFKDRIFTEQFCKTFNITRDLDPDVEESMDDFIMRRSQALNNFHMLKASKIVPETMDFDTFLKRIQSTEVVEDPYENLVKEFQSLVEKFTNYVPETTLAHLLADVKTFFENTDLNFWIMNQNNPKLIQLLVESCKKLELKDENLKNLFKVLGQTVLKNV